MNKCCDIFDVFDKKNNLIKEYAHWKLLIRNRNHSKLGICVAITKQHHSALSEISEEEMKEYATVTKDAEKGLKKAFSPDLIHHQLLMFFDKHTHFHITPRYQNSRSFAGMEWTDDWNPDPLVQKRDSLPQEILSKIKEEIKKNLP